MQVAPHTPHRMQEVSSSTPLSVTGGIVDDAAAAWKAHTPQKCVSEQVRR